MTQFYLVRHGEAQYELAEERKLIGGMRDLVPLTARGREQAKYAAGQLLAYGIRKVVASPMTRAMETAHILAYRLQVPLEVEFDLHEWLPDLQCAYGSAAYVKEQAAEMHSMNGEWPAGSPRTWEPLSQVRQRVMAALDRHSKDAPLAVAVHGTVIYALTGQNASHCQVVPYRFPDRR